MIRVQQNVKFLFFRNCGENKKINFRIRENIFKLYI